MTAAAMQLGSMMTGYWISQMIYVAATLGIADLLAHGPRTAEELAKETSTQPDALFRLLRALASVGIFREDEPRRFALTPLAEPLQSDVPGSQRAFAILVGDEHYESWGQLLYSVQTGQTAFDKIYGEPCFDWLSKHPERAANFDRAMTSVHGRETDAVAQAYDFSNFGTLADVGGGNGSVLSAILARNPKLAGMLCDLPGVIERARPVVTKAGLAERMQMCETNFFEAVPTGADAYLMRHIIHDWDDAKANTILRNVRRVIPPEGRLLVIESVIPPGNDPSFGKLLDLNMLVIPGGKERSESEYRQLLAATGFELSRIVPTASEVSVIEGIPT